MTILRKHSNFVFTLRNESINRDGEKNGGKEGGTKVMAPPLRRGSTGGEDDEAGVN